MRAAATEAFIEAGEIAHEAGVLPDALLELAVRLDLKGAGDLLALITDGTCWAPRDEVCPRCGQRRPPDPHPKPPRPPQDPRPKPGGGR